VNVGPPHLVERSADFGPMRYSSRHKLFCHCMACVDSSHEALAVSASLCRVKRSVVADDKLMDSSFETHRVDERRVKEIG